MDYMGIILKGVSEPNTRQYLPEYLIREHKKAEDEGYTKDEFFSGCRLAYEELAAELDKNRSFILQNVIFENDEDLQSTLKNETVNLRVFTRQKFAGYLNEGDIQYIRSCIVEAMLSGASSEAEPDKLTFPDYLIPSSSGTTEDRRAEVMALAEKIKSILPIKKPKVAAAVFWVLHKEGKISITQPTPAYNVMKEYFGDIGSRAGFAKNFVYDIQGLNCTIETGFIDQYSKLIFS